MPNLSYLVGGEPITAELLNDLWSEFDRKMSLMMDGKSWLLFGQLGAQTSINTILGKRFFFTNLTTFGRSIDLGGSNYDHSVFTDAIAAGTQIDVDHANKIATMTIGANLDNSLEAHRRDTLNAESETESYWVWQDGKVMPQKRHRYAVAELIFEDAGETEFTIPAEWNKCQYFRCHNLNSVDITVTFEGATDDYALLIPRWGCKCVQRRPGGDCEAGYNYFWKFKPGDPRSLFCVPFDGNPAAESMRVNNVWNPSLLFEVIHLFSESGAANLDDNLNPVRFIRDPHVIYEIDHLYTDYFADPAVTSNLLGDILHHKGALHYLYKDPDGAVQRVIGAFEGYGAALASLSTMGLTVTVDSSGVTVQGEEGSAWNDLVTPGSNLLFGDDGAIVTAAEITSARAIEHKQPPDGLFIPFGEGVFFAVDVEEGSNNPEYREWSIDADNVVTLVGSTPVPWTSQVIHAFAKDATDTLKPHADTIAHALLFNTFGVVALAGTNQDSDICEMQNRRIALTAFGPIILWEQRYAINVGMQGGNLFSALWTGAGSWPTTYRQLIDTEIIERRYLPWGGYGWPAFPSWAAGAWNNTHPGFIGPRRARAHNAKLSGSKHPNILDPIFGPNGQDFRIGPKARNRSEIRLLFTPGLDSPDDGHMGVWQSSDQLFEYEGVSDLDANYDSALRTSMQSGPTSTNMPRVPLLREHYNTMAAWINSIKKCRPYCWTDFVHYLADTEETVIGKGDVALVWDNDISDGVSPGSGTRGILGTTIRPVNQYCSFEEDSPLYRLFDALGVTIKTEANLPSGLIDAFTTSAIFKRPKGTVSAMIDSATSIGTNHWRYKTHEELSVLEYTDGLEGAALISTGTVNNAFGAQAPSYPLDGDGYIVLEDYFWVTVSDVKAAAEAMGFLFIWEEMSIPITLQSFDIADTITPLVTTTAYSYFEEFSVDAREVGVSSSFDFGHNPSEQLIHPVDDIQTEQLMFVQTATLPAWKRDWPALVARRVTDVTPADVGLYGLLAQNFVLQVSVPDACRRELRFLRQSNYEYKTTLLYQILASAAYTNQSAALKIPSPYAYHADDDFSLLSEDNARAALAFRPQIYPFEMVGTYGPASVQGFTSGNNFVVAAAGLSHEVYIWQDVFVNLDLERITEESIQRATEEGVTREIE